MLIPFSKSSYNRKIYAVDVFCGAGGLTNGLIKAGVDVRLGIDIDSACEYPYTKNNSVDFLLKSIKHLEGRDLLPYYRKNGIKLLAGCAPCQTFSAYNPKANSGDERWDLLLDFARLTRELSPDLVTMENVPRLTGKPIFKQFLLELEMLGYHFDYRIVDCSHYGVPQRRRRLVLLASKLGSIALLKPSELDAQSKTVRDTIFGLPHIKAGHSDEKDRLHRSGQLSELNMNRIKVSKSGGTWRDWPEELVAECHKKPTGKTYSSVYSRMVWDKPAPTITTEFFSFGTGRFGHPKQNRAISLREGALLQGFPDDYEFVHPNEKVLRTTVGRLIGNAVPVGLGEAIGRSLRTHVSKMTREKINSKWKKKRSNKQ